MTVNIKFYYTLTSISLAAMSLASFAATTTIPVQACVIARDVPLTLITRSKVADCLGWRANTSIPLCHGSYQPLEPSPLGDTETIHIKANEVSLYAQGQSQLKGNVEVRQGRQIVNAQTANIYRDDKTNKVTKIELLGEVHFLEPDRLMIARKAQLNPEDKTGDIEDALYRFKNERVAAILPAWGRASLIQRYANKDLLLRKVTYTTCAPQDKAWQIEAKEIVLHKAEGQGVAKDAILRVGDTPVLYTPYFSFPTSKERKSGFLMPMVGYSNIGGFDIGLPYYLNLAPNYDATIVPHEYTLRGFMIGGDYRFLTQRSKGTIGGNILPNDNAFKSFIAENKNQFPELQNLSNNRWSVFARDDTAFASNLHLNIDYQQVSDNYYLQDFSSNIAVITENQLLRQGELVYTTDHWLLSGMAQSYQTLHPINQSAVADIYQRLPQVLANGTYIDILPFHGNFNLMGIFDNYRWPTNTFSVPQGPRYHLDPIVTFPNIKPWGYITPTAELVENYYNVNYIGESISNNFNRTIPRYSVDGGLTFERSRSLMGDSITQTLEPRLYYLYVPFRNQTAIPVYDSAYMIFNYDQLFRNNRFSGIDRIGDANQLAYGMTTRWLSDVNGKELAQLSVGQLRYFSTRKVQLCYQQFGNCIDTPLTLGFLSPNSTYSPIASHAALKLSRQWEVSGDYVWDTYTNSTNNGDINFHYQPEENHIFNVGYAYLTGGNILQVNSAPIQTKPLNQALAAFAWPVLENWSALGAYSYNISEGYNMMSFLGVQYDNCCWAMRLMGGRVFQSITPNTLTPEYNNNIYFQILLKGLGSVATSDPATVISTYLPTYKNIF